MKEKFIVIDGNSIMHRAYHALPFLSANGVSTNAVYGVMSMFLKVVREQQPTYIACCFDVAKKVFRHEFYEDYKAGRKKTEPELIEQFPLMKEFFKAMDIPIIERKGYEADDLIGSICKKFQQVDTYVLTGDKDSLQLIDDNTFVFLMRKGISDIALFDRGEFERVYGVAPEQFVDVKALMGDKSDNIPGVTKVGEKTALRLIRDYGNLDGVYANLDKEKGKLKENLENDRELAYISQRLAAIDVDLEIDNRLQDFAFTMEDIEKAYGLLEKYSMKSLISRNANNGEKAEKQKDGDKLDYKQKPIVVLDSEESLADAVGKLAKEPLCLIVSDGNIMFSDGEHNFAVNQQMNFFEKSITREQVFKLLDGHLKKYGVISDDGKKLLEYTADGGYNWEVVFDVGLASYIVNSNKKNYAIGELIKEYTTETQTNAYAMHKIYLRLKDEVEEFGNIFYDMEMPLTKVLFQMERTGFAVDVATLKELSAAYRKIMVELEQEVFDIAGETFNLNSPKQLSAVLFEKMGLKAGKKTKMGYSTDAESLEKLRDGNPIIDKVLSYRKYAKLLGTYIDGFLPLLDKDSRVHTEFLQKGTTTGRIASKEPNLQNIPVRTEEGREIRNAFVAKEGYTLVCADYSQIELRVLAHISGDEVMIDAFKNGQDIHTRTASEIMGVAPDKVDRFMRRSAKAINFGIVYGLSPYGLSSNLGISFKEAKDYITAYLKRYEGVQHYMTAIVESAKEKGYVDTLLGRRRYIPQIHSPNKNIVSFGERVALNTPIQGTAADMIKIAMIKTAKGLEPLASKLILQVHDELIVEARDDEVEQVKGILKECMENVLELKVPIIVDISAGKRWTK